MRSLYKVTPSGIGMNKRRWKSIKNLKIDVPALDACEPNEIALKYGITHFAEGDFNWEFVAEWKAYRTITSFEVIEHLQNPLFYLLNIYKHLSPGGKLILTTPVRWCLSNNKAHFHEFSQDELLFCLKEAGFQTVSIQRIQAYDFKLTGIRPIIRKLRDIIYGQCFLVIAIK
jgi:hypothetical protein